MAVDGSRPGREVGWSNLSPGDGQKLAKNRTPVHERAAEGLRLQYGDHVGMICRAILSGIKHKTIDITIGRLILNKVLPTDRPLQLDFPEIMGPEQVIECETKIARALNEGRISPTEARTLQAWARTAWRTRKMALAEMGTRR